MRLFKLICVLFILFCFFVTYLNARDKRMNKEFRDIEIKERRAKKKKKEKPLSVAYGVKKIAVLPFFDLTKKNRKETEMFADKIASQLVQTRMFDVKYPKEVISKVLTMEFTRELHNFDKEDKYKLGKALGVEALVFGEVKEMDLYEPTKISYSLKMFIVDKNRNGTQQEIWDLSSYGVPLKYVRDKDWERFSMIWAPQNVCNTSLKSVQKRIKKYAKKMDFEDHAFGWKYIIRSNERFLEFVSFEIGQDLLIAANPKYRKRSGAWYRLKDLFKK
ncbi:MAG: hypothetical protein COA79_15025 [Planctomycetota bacterium]|nr:MAG: hypothetical protein COA79_15025 [Planctomycetota bacterium]